MFNIIAPSCVYNSLLLAPFFCDGASNPSFIVATKTKRCADINPVFLIVIVYGTDAGADNTSDNLTLKNEFAF